MSVFEISIVSSLLTISGTSSVASRGMRALTASTAYSLSSRIISIKNEGSPCTPNFSSAKADSSRASEDLDVFKTFLRSLTHAVPIPTILSASKNRFGPLSRAATAAEEMSATMQISFSSASICTSGSSVASNSNSSSICHYLNLSNRNSPSSIVPSCPDACRRISALR